MRQCITQDIAVCVLYSPIQFIKCPYAYVMLMYMINTTYCVIVLILYNRLGSKTPDLRRKKSTPDRPIRVAKQPPTTTKVTKTVTTTTTTRTPPKQRLVLSYVHLHT